VGSGAIRSGQIGSGQVGQFHLASGAVTSGRLGVAGTPTGTTFLRDDFVWAGLTVALGSGNVQSGHIGNAAVTSGNIASGQLGWSHLASGAVRSGHLGDGAVVSGSVASGHISTAHLASGTIVESARKVVKRQWVAGEPISGGFPVRVASGGLLRPAFADFGLGLNTNPAFGVAHVDIASGALGEILQHGTLIQPLAYSGFVFSGRPGQHVFVNTQANIALGQPPLTPDPSVITSGGFHQVIGLAMSGSETVDVIPNTEVIGIESL
jgi:hypothetical protein